MPKTGEWSFMIEFAIAQQAKSAQEPARLMRRPPSLHLQRAGWKGMILSRRHVSGTDENIVRQGSYRDISNVKSKGAMVRELVAIRVAFYAWCLLGVQDSRP